MRSLAIFIMATASLFAVSCSDGCGNQIVRTVLSPDGTHRAILFERDCGAATDFSTQLSILPAGEQLSGAGNVITADADHGTADSEIWGGPWIEFRWLAPRHLLVRYDARAHVFQQRESVADVIVTYQAVDRRKRDRGSHPAVEPPQA